jgi:hypothetical protein
MTIFIPPMNSSTGENRQEPGDTETLLGTEASRFCYQFQALFANYY